MNSKENHQKMTYFSCFAEFLKNKSKLLVFSPLMEYIEGDRGGAILRRNDFLHLPWKLQKFTEMIVQRRKTFLNSPGVCSVCCTKKSGVLLEEFKNDATLKERYFLSSNADIISAYAILLGMVGL